MKRTMISVAILVACLSDSAAEAQIRDFPYDAVVVADEAFVRSGAGDAYYPTQRVPRDTVVKVLRHDPGGWYMIEPPAGSFSWVPERYIKQTSDTEGEVTENTAAFVGSEFGDEVTVFQRTLKPGEKVTIEGKRDIDTTSGLQTMLKIAPPTRERRWIPGAAIVPVDPQKRQQLNSDPYAVPGNAARPQGAIVTPSQLNNAPTIASGVTNVPEINPSAQLSQLQALRKEQQQLAEIDRRFREMVLQDASGWDLDSIEAEYQRLQQSTNSKPVSGQIDMRYPAIERYRRRLSQLNELRKVTSQTEQRDAALVARHGGASSMPGPLRPLPLSGAMAPAPSAAGPEIMMAAGTTPQVAREFEAFLAESEPNEVTPPVETASFEIPQETDSEAASPATVVPSGPAPNGVLTPGSPQNRFIGAGIVQRSTDGSPGSGFVLVSPGGKVLADLKPSGSVRLESYLGQSVGILGARWSEKDKRDIIEVSTLETVRLRQ